MNGEGTTTEARVDELRRLIVAGYFTPEEIAELAGIELPAKKRMTTKIAEAVGWLFMLALSLMLVGVCFALLVWLFEAGWAALL